jgi:TonB family protein
VGCIVNEKGVPQQIHVVRSLSEAFDRNALRAVQQYQFAPAMLQDKSGPKAVAVEVNIEVNFKPPVRQ